MLLQSARWIGGVLAPGPGHSRGRLGDVPETVRTAQPRMSAEKQWWLRFLAVFQSPTAVFAAMRDDSDDQAHARQEPVLAAVWLAGIAGVLALGSTTGRLLDDDGTASDAFGLTAPRLDGLDVAVLIFLAGGVYGLASYWLGGGALYVGARGAGSSGSYRRVRHVLGYALAPVALSLLVVWPLRLAAYGGDNFRSGGADEAGAGRFLFEALEAAFFVWSLALLVIGIRAVHGWPALRAVVAIALAALVTLAVALAFRPSLVTSLG